VPASVQALLDAEQKASPATDPSKLPQATTAVRSSRTLQTIDSREYNDSSSCPTTQTYTPTTTLVLQTSLDRAWILLETCRHRWKTHPIVAILALLPQQQQDQDQESLPLLRQNLTAYCPHLELLVHPLLLKSPERYPVNELRNMGLQAVQTSHVLVADIDLVPSVDLDLHIQESIVALRKPTREAETQHQALVVPAFERVCGIGERGDEGCYHALKRNHTFLPADFEALQACIIGDKRTAMANNGDNAACVVFQSRDNWEGHFSTRSAQWMASMMQYIRSKSNDRNDEPAIRTLDCFDSLRYEPYVVIPWCPVIDRNHDARKPLAPYYDERFHGYGKNKIQYIQHLRFLQFKFSILSRPGFLIHNPHPASAAKQVWLHKQDGGEARNLHQEMDQLYPKFLQELVGKYFTQEKSFSWRREYPNVVGLCKRNQGSTVER